MPTGSRFNLRTAAFLLVMLLVWFGLIAFFVCLFSSMFSPRLARIWVPLTVAVSMFIAAGVGVLWLKFRVAKLQRQLRSDFKRDCEEEGRSGPDGTDADQALSRNETALCDRSAAAPPEKKAP